MAYSRDDRFLLTVGNYPFFVKFDNLHIFFSEILDVFKLSFTPTVSFVVQAVLFLLGIFLQSYYTM